MRLPKMPDKKKFKKLLGDTFVGCGFLRKGKAWVREGKDSTLVLDLQKSDYDDKYYINFGIWLNRFGVPEQLAAYRCHLNIRLDALFPEDVRTIEEGGRVDAHSNDALDKLVDLIQTKFLPLSGDCLDETRLRQLLAAGRFQRGLVLAIAKDALAEHE